MKSRVLYFEIDQMNQIRYSLNQEILGASQNHRGQTSHFGILKTRENVLKSVRAFKGIILQKKKLYYIWVLIHF